MGVPLEDLGVIPNEPHQMTREDVLNGNKDLIEKAASLFAGMTVRELRGRVDGIANGSAQVTATTRHVTRIDAYVDKRPRATVDIAADGSHSFAVPGVAGAGTLELRGFQDDELVVATLRRHPCPFAVVSSNSHLTHLLLSEALVPDVLRV